MNKRQQGELFAISTTTRITTPRDQLRTSAMPPELAANAEDQARTIGDLPRKLRMRAEEVAAVLECDDAHVYRLIEDGTLDAVNVADDVADAPRPLYRVYTYSVAKLLDDRRRRAGRLVAEFFSVAIDCRTFTGRGVCEFVNLPPEDYRRTLADMPSKLRMRVEEVAAFIECDENHIYRLIEDGTLDAVNLARHTETRPMYRVYSYSLARFMTERREGAWS